MLTSRYLTDAKRREYEADLQFTNFYERELNRIVDFVEGLMREESSPLQHEKIQAPNGQALGADQTEE